MLRGEGEVVFRYMAGSARALVLRTRERQAEELLSGELTAL
jgi:hypothetical protein